MLIAECALVSLSSLCQKYQTSPPYTFFLLNDDMELHRNRHLFI